MPDIPEEIQKTILLGRLNEPEPVSELDNLRNELASLRADYTVLRDAILAERECSAHENSCKLCGTERDGECAKVWVLWHRSVDTMVDALKVIHRRET